MGALPMKKVAMKKAAMKSAAMKKAGAGAMKRVMKAKKVSKIAKGKHARASVFSGRKEKNKSGMTKDKLTKNKRETRCRGETARRGSCHSPDHCAGGRGRPRAGRIVHRVRRLSAAPRVR